MTTPSASRRLLAALLSLSAPAAQAAEDHGHRGRPGRCPEVLARLSGVLADATCFESPDLTTANELPPPAGPTTPADNSLAGAPPFAYTPRTDRAVIAPSPAKRPPIARAVPGIQLQARFAGDPTGQARFLLRLPDDWNGRLVVAGASGNRSEFNGDYAWSDFAVQRGYAYASQNKGMWNLRFTTPDDPLGCRLNPASPLFVRFYVNDPDQSFGKWAQTMGAAARAARQGIHARYGRGPRHTYAVGTSNGGYQVRRAVESFPDLFDGGVDWEGTFVDPGAPNLLTDLPAAVRNFPDFAAGGFDMASTAARNMLAAGYPPDLPGTPSYWTRHNGSFWEVTQCQWQKRLDPGYDTYGAGPGDYNYVARLSASDVGAQMAAFATTGRIRRPLVTVAGTMDALLPIDHHARAYARKVRAACEEDVAYRLYEIQNGSHLETYQDFYPQLELILPHAHRAFELLVDHVERRAALPPDQCVPRGGAIAGSPGQAGHCAGLLAP